MFSFQGDNVELLIRPANHDYNLDRCRLFSYNYVIPYESDDFYFTYEYYNAHLPPATGNSDSHISSYAGYNWQDSPNSKSVTNTESRVINSKMPNLPK